MGYNALVGDMNAMFSGDQKQRVVLARAPYKGPRILFLDEVTSHLDIRYKRRINATIHTLYITRIMIIHQSETIASMDHMTVLGQGKISLDESTTRLTERQTATAREQAWCVPSPACYAVCSAWFPTPPPTSRTYSVPSARSPTRRSTIPATMAYPAATDRHRPG